MSSTLEVRNPHTGRLIETKKFFLESAEVVAEVTGVFDHRAISRAFVTAECTKCGCTTGKQVELRNIRLFPSEDGNDVRVRLSLFECKVCPTLAEEAECPDSDYFEECGCLFCKNELCSVHLEEDGFYLWGNVYTRCTCHPEN